MLIIEGTRFVNKKLDKLVKLCHGNRNGTLTAEEAGIFKLLKHKMMQSGEKIFTRDKEKVSDKAYNKYDKIYDKYDEKYKKNKITEKKYNRKLDRAEYLHDKKMYSINKDDYRLDEKNERPKNPLWNNIKEDIISAKNSAKEVLVKIGNLIAKPFKAAPKLLAAGVKTAYKGQYKARKRTIKGVKTLAKGVKFVGSKVLSVAKGAKDKYTAATKGLREEADMEMISKAEKRQSKKTPRESLDLEHVEINHEQAKQNAEKEGQDKQVEQEEQL